ncbi:MAG: outer membrane beta-barrel protein [Burkholderiales bacterium]
MKAKWTVSALLCVSSLFVPIGAHAQKVFLGASGGASFWNVDCTGTTACDDSSNAFRGFIGYNFVDIAGRVQLGIEGFYTSFGKVSARLGFGSSTRSVEATGYGLAFAASGRFVPGGRFGYLARIGIANVESEMITTFPSRTVSSASALSGVVGLGTNFFISQNFSVRAEADVASVKWPDGQTSGVISILGGVALHF